LLHLLGRIHPDDKYRQIRDYFSQPQLLETAGRVDGGNGLERGDVHGALVPQPLQDAGAGTPRVLLGAADVDSYPSGPLSLLHGSALVHYRDRRGIDTAWRSGVAG